MAYNVAHQKSAPLGIPHYAARRAQIEFKEGNLGRSKNDILIFFLKLHDFSTFEGEKLKIIWGAILCWKSKKIYCF